MVVIFRTCHSLSHPFSSSCLVYSFLSFLLRWGKKGTNLPISLLYSKDFLQSNVFFNFFYLVFDWGILNITLGSLSSLYFLFVFEAVGILLQDEQRLIQGRGCIVREMVSEMHPKYISLICHLFCVCHNIYFCGGFVTIWHIAPLTWGDNSIDR